MAPNIRVPANFGIEHINSEVHGNLVLKLKDGQQIKTNSMIMSLNSPVIDNLTTNMFQSTLEMDDFTKPAVDCFVEAMYSGEVEKLEKDIFEDVNKMAHVFDVSWLTKRCVKFYRNSTLQFEKNSYEEILFACEIASRASYNLKQSYYVGYFVSNIASRKIGKMMFLQRYTADFAALSKRQIDMSLALAGNYSNLIMILLVSHVTRTLKSKKLDENSLYVLQNFNAKKFCLGFPTDFNETSTFLAEIADMSNSSEVKELVKEFAKTKSIVAASSSKDFVTEDIETTDDCDNDKSDSGDVADVSVQTEEVEYGWIKPVPGTWHPVLLDKSVQFITTDNEPRRGIYTRFTLSCEKRTDERQFDIRCEDVGTSKWSYTIGSCFVDNWNVKFLNDVPHDNVKHWIILKTITHLTLVCNKVTVLNFNLTTDCDANKRNGGMVWSRKVDSVKLQISNRNYYNSLVVRTKDGS